MSEEYSIPEDLYYTEEHEWAKVDEDGTVTVGITDYAQKQLHEIVYVELPDVGAEVEQLSIIGAVESVKAVSDMNCPVGGVVTEVNDELLDSPELLNDDPYGEGWIVKLKPSDLEGDKVRLMDAEAYRKHVAEAVH